MFKVSVCWWIAYVCFYLFLFCSFVTFVSLHWICVFVNVDARMSTHVSLVILYTTRVGYSEKKSVVYLMGRAPENILIVYSSILVIGLIYFLECVCDDVLSEWAKSYKLNENWPTLFWNKQNKIKKNEFKKKHLDGKWSMI